MSFLLKLDVSALALKGLWITLGVLVFFIVYRIVLRRMKREIPDLKSFVILHPLELEEAQGKIDFYFTMEEPQFINFSVYNEQDELVKQFHNEEMEAGPHIVAFDTNSVENGKYSFAVKTDQQHTMKYFIINN